MGLFDAQNDTLNLDPKAVRQSLSRLNSMRASAPPPAPPEPEERGLFGETAAAVKRGGLQVVDMAGNIAKAFDPEGGIDIVRNASAGLSNFARNRAAQPDVAESSYVKNHPILGNIPKAVEMAVPSIGVPLAAAGGAALAGASAPVTAAVGIGAPALAFGISQFQDTKERALDAGVSRAEANKAGIKTGLIEGGMEAASNLIPFSKVFKLAKPVQGTVLKSMFKSPTWKALGKKLAVDTAQIMGGEVSTEMGQAYLQAKVEKNAGIRPDANPWQEAKDVIGPTIGLSLITGGVVGGANKLSRVASQRALQNPGVHEDVRRSAMENVHAGLVDAENKGVAPAGSADNWRRNVEAAIKAKAPLVLSDDLLTTARTAAPEVHDEQVKNDALEALALAADPTNDLGVSDAVQVVNQKKAEDAVTRRVAPEPAALTPEPAALTPESDPFEAQMSAAAQDGGVALSKREEGPTPEMHQWAESNGMEFTPGKLMPNMEQRWWGLQQKQEAPAEQVQTPEPEQPWEMNKQEFIAEVRGEPATSVPVEQTSTHTPPPAGQYRQHVVQRDENGKPLVVAVERPDGVVGLLNTKGGVTAAFENATDPDHPYIQAYREAVARGEVDQGPAPNAAFVKGTQQFDDKLREVAAMRITPRKTSRATATFKELSSVDAEYIPAHVVNAVAAPREVMTAVGTATKQQTKDTLNTFLSSGDLSPQNPIRLTTVEELHDIIKNGTLRPGKDFEGRSGISAQLVDGKKPIVAYGPNDKISAAIVFPEHAAVGKGMAPNEVKVSEKTDVADLRFVVDGFRALMSFGELKEAVRKTTPREEKKGGAAADQGTAKNSLKGFEKWPAARRLAVLNTHYRNARGESLPAGSFRESGNRALRDSLAKVARIFGHDVTLMERGPDGMPAGFAVGIDRKNIYIQEGVSDHPLAILGHEMVHQMKAYDPALFDELAKGLMALRNYPAMEMYLQAFDTVDASTVEEWVADVFGNSMTREGFWSEFEKASPSLAGRVATFVHDLITKFKDKLLTGRTGLAAQTIKDFRKVERLTAEVARRYAEREGSAQEAAENAEITFKELTSLNPKEQAKGINRAFRDIPYGRVLKDAMKSAYRFFMPMDRTVNLLASMANYKPIQTQLKQFLSQRKGKAGYLQAAMTNAHHVIKTMGKAFTTEADEKKLADLAFTSTLYQVHADPRMADGWTEDSWVTSGQDQVTGKSLGDARREVRAMYNALTPEQKKAHRAMLDHFQHLRDDAKNHALDPVKQLFGDDVFARAERYLANEQQILASNVEVPQLVKDAAKAIKTKMQAFPELKGDYVPLMRFGNYQARINEVDENGEMGKRTYAEFFDTKEDALRFIAGINQNTATSGQMATLEVADDKLRRAHVNVPGSYADQIKDALQNKYKEALESGDADTQALIESMIEAAHDEAQAVRVNTLPRTTTEGSKLHREGVAGFSRDIVKVFATYSRNNALANSRLIYGEQINQTFRDMKNTIKAFDSEPSEPGQEKQHALMSADMQDAYNWLYRMDKEGDQEKVHELAQMLGKASAFWYLSSPSTWLVQWSQPFIFTVPHMAARFGFHKALAEYTKAAKRYLSGYYSDEKIDDFDRSNEFVGRRMSNLIEKSRTATMSERAKINRELKSIYESFPDPKDREMLALKVLSHQNAVDLSAAHMVQDLTAGATDGTKTFDKLVNGSAWFMQHSESGSRRAAAVSSFNMAFDKDGDFLKANDYAVDTISKTLYDFDSSNRGEAWRGSWGRVFGIFRFFQLHTIGQITQLSKDALGAEFKRDIAAANGDQAKVKEATDRMHEARKELAYIMGSSFALAGALGTPLSTLFSNSAMNLIWSGLALAFGDDDDPWDPRRDFEMMVRRNLNSTAADVVLKGLPSLVGADVSRRIGLGTIGDIINGEPPPGISSAQKFGWYAGRALGPAGGMVMDGVRVLDELEKGNLIEALRYGTPKGIRDMVKAFQVASEGVKSGGNTILKGEDVSPYSYALMFMGVNPLDVSLAQEESRYLKNISAVLSQRRSGLVKDLAEAVVNQDEDAKEAAIEEINGWQTAHPKLAITAQQVVQAIKRRQKAEENVPTKREQIIQEEYGQEGGEGDGEM